MAVRTKFKVQSITMTEGTRPKQDSTEWEVCEVCSVSLVPVGSGSEENKAFWRATPSGQITIGCATIEAAVAFKIGKEFYVDFIPADAVVKE